MLVVADTSPIHVLIRIEHIEILPSLFTTVLIPSVVEEELLRAKYEVVRQFMAARPEWLRCTNPMVIEQIPRIHPGEEAAIALATEINADALLMDDHDARTEAVKRGLRIVGTLGILERAFQVGLIDLRLAIDRIRETDFHVTDGLLQSVLDRHYPQVSE
jgi:predicted nucleic acid-binding protein